MGLTRWQSKRRFLSMVARVNPIPRPCWNVERIVTDMALRGWNTSTLAREAGIAHKTVDRFLTGRVQTTKTAAAIANAFGYSVKRYLSHVEAVA